MMDLLCYFSSKNIFYIDTGVGGGGGGGEREGETFVMKGPKIPLAQGPLKEQ